MKAFTAIMLTASLAGCSRWEPQTKGMVELSHACPMKRAPAVADYGASGVRGAYHFVVDGAPKADVATLLRDTEAARFEIMPMTVNLNGKDSLFFTGPSLLHTQEQIDDEFNLACHLGHGRVYLTYVRYDLPAPGTDAVRVC